MFCCYSRQSDDGLDLGYLRNIFKPSDEDSPKDKTNILAQRKRGSGGGPQNKDGGLGLM
jgi:hypothetical protein